MAGKKMTDYKHNAKMSLKNLGFDLYTSYFPNLHSTATEIRDGYKELRKSKTTVGFNDIRSKIRHMPLVKFVSDMTKTAFEGLRTGKFYQSEEEIFGLNFDFGDFDMPDDSAFFDDMPSDNSDVQQGQSLSDDNDERISESGLFSAVGNVAKATSVSVARSSSAASRATVEGLYLVAQSINSAIATTTTDLKAQMLNTQKSIDGLASLNRETHEAIQKSVAIQTEMLSEIKQLREISGDFMIPQINKPHDAENVGTPEWYTKLKKGETGEGLKEIGQTIARSIDNQASMGMFSQISNAIPLIMMTSGGNPFALLKTWGLEPWLDKHFKLEEFKSRFDARIKSLPNMIDSFARTASLSDNSIIRSIGDSLRTHRDMRGSVPTDKYDKGNRVFFDGMTREAIINVIPTYLSSIVSLLAGRERTTYDYEKGMFRSITHVRDEFFQKMPKLDYNYSGLATLLKETMSDGDRNGLNEERLNSFAKIILERLAESSYTLKDLKNHSYNKALETLKLTEDELTESDFLKLRSQLERLETGSDTYHRFNKIEKALENYIQDRNTFMENSAYSARKNGLISTLNNSWIMDNDAAVGLANLGTVKGGKKSKSGAQSGAKPIHYDHLLKGWGEASVGSSKELGNLYGQTLSDEEIETINEYQKKNLGGAKIFLGDIGTSARVIAKAKIFEKLKIDREQWFQDFVGTSHYNIDSILGNKEFLDNLVNANVNEADMAARLEAMGIDEAGIERITDVVTDPSKSQDDIRSTFQDELDKTSFVSEAKASIRDAIDSAQSTIASQSVDDSSTKLGQAKDKLSSAYEKTVDTISKTLGETKDSISKAYDENKSTVNGLLKASLGLGAGYAFLKTLGNTGVGKMVGAFGLLSPVAIAAGALGAGIYAYKTDLFGRLFGDGNKTEATLKKTTNIVKTGLVGAGTIAGLSTILTPITGGAFGLMGPAALALSGLALGIAGESGKFKKMIFGTEEGSFLHNMKEWMFGDELTGKTGILTNAGKNISEFFGQTTDKMKRWFKEDIWNPLSQTFKPINNFINTTANKLFSAITGIPATLQSSLFANIKVNLTRPLMEKFDQGFLQPIGGFLKKMTGGLGRFFGGLISAPFKFFRTLITGKTDSDVFYGSYGSSTATNTEYKSNMREKQKLYDETKYMSLDEVNSKYSKKDIKQIRKFRAKQAQTETEEDVQESKSLQDRLADYKERKSQENPKGVSKRYYYNQNKIKAKGRIFNMSYAGCGISCLASALSHALSEKVQPTDLMTEAYGWDDDKFKDGVPFTFMSNVLWNFQIDARISTKNTFGVSTETIDNCLKKNGTVIIDVDDWQTGQAHCLLIVGVKGDEYICFDPARGPNEKYSKSVLANKIKRHILVFQKRTFGDRIKEKYMTLKDAIPSQKEMRVNAKILKRKIQRGAQSVQDGFSDVINKLPKGSLGEFLEEKANEAKARRSEFLKEAKEGSTIKTLIKSSQEIHKTLREFRQDNNDNLNELMDKLEVQTNGVAYNLEYIKRLLTKVHGVEVEGFSERDIAKTGMTKIVAWFRKKFRSAYNIISKPINFVLDRINGFFDRVNNVVNFITTFPQRIASSFHKFISALLPSKEQIISLIDIGKKFISNLYAGTKQLISDTWKSVKDVSKIVKDTIISGAKKAVDAVGNAAKYIGEKTMLGIRWGFDKLMKGASWIADKAWQGAKWSAGKIKDGYEWAKEKLTGVKRSLKNIIAPREVYVTGGHLNGVQVVEVVKAVGAVDLDYAESMARKLKSSNHKKNIENIRQGKVVPSSHSEFKSPKFKSGQEYNDIDKRQDTQVQSTALVVQNQNVESKEEKGSSFIPMIAGKLGKFGEMFMTSFIPKLMSFAGLATTIAAPYFAHKFTESEIAQDYKEFVDSKGYDGERTLDNVKKSALRMSLRTSLNVATKMGFMKASREAFENTVKGLAQKNLAKIGVSSATKTIREKLTQLFLNNTIRKILGDRICDGFLKAVPRIATKAGTTGAKAAAKASVRMGAYAAPPVGILVDIAAITWDLTSGMTWDAGNIMGVKQKDLSVTQRCIAGAVKMIQGFLASKGPLIFLALIPTDWLAQTLYEMVADEDEYNKWVKDNEKYKEMKALEEKELQEKKQAIVDRAVEDASTSKPNTYTNSVTNIQAKYANHSYGLAMAKAKEFENITYDKKVETEQPKTSTPTTDVQSPDGTTLSGASELGKSATYGITKKKKGLFGLSIGGKDVEFGKKSTDIEVEQPKTSTPTTDVQSPDGTTLSNASELGKSATYGITKKSQYPASLSVGGKDVAYLTFGSKKNYSSKDDYVGDEIKEDIKPSEPIEQPKSISEQTESVVTDIQDNKIANEIIPNTQEPKVEAPSTPTTEAVVKNEEKKEAVKEEPKKKKKPKTHLEYLKEKKDKIQEMFDWAKAKYGEVIAKNFMKIAYAESNWKQEAFNKHTEAAGLFQVLPTYRTSWGFKKNEDPTSFDHLEQIKKVAPYLLSKAKRNGAEPTLTNMYAALHYPVAVGKDDDWVLYGENKDPKAYKWNRGVDYDKDGNVTYKELGQFVAKNGLTADAYASKIGLSGYGPMKMISQGSPVYSKLSMGSNMSFKDAGCGPAVMAMLLDKLDISYKMEHLVQAAKDMKAYETAGTPITYFKEVLKSVGISSTIYYNNVQKRFISELKMGKSPILLTEASNGNPHYIIGKEYIDGKIVINDPEKSSSETITINDRRLRRARAIVVYVVPSRLSKITSEASDGVMSGGYGIFDGVSKTIDTTKRNVIKSAEKKAYSYISKNSKYDIVDKIAKEAVRKQVRSANSVINDALSPINKGIGAVNSTQRTITSKVNSIKREATNIMNTPEKMLDKTITGSMRELQSTLNSAKKIINDSVNVGNLVNEKSSALMKQAYDSKNIVQGNGASEALFKKMTQELSEIKTLMSKLVTIMSEERKPQTLVHNGKSIYTTIGGRPVPLSASGQDDWYTNIDRIARGQ